MNQTTTTKKLTKLAFSYMLFGSPLLFCMILYPVHKQSYDTAICTKFAKKKIEARALSDLKKEFSYEIPTMIAIVC